jgi:hypothetical protein
LAWGNKGGNNGPILTWADTVIAKVADKYGNPISNEAVDFSIGNPVERTTCPNPNVDSQKGALVKISNTCLDNNIPAYGDCLPVTQTITEITSDIGAAVQVILGGVPDADYPITINSDSIKKRQDPDDPDSLLVPDPDKVETVTVTSLSFGNCDGWSLPDYDLVLKDINLTDGLGNIVNAGPIGGTIPIQARMYYLKELGEEKDETVTCPDATTDACKLFVGTRNYTVSTDFETASVTMQADDSTDAIQAIDQNGGVFAASAYPLGSTPGKKVITITGNASTMVRESYNMCDSDSQTACVLEPTELTADPISITKEIYAVEVEPVKAEYIIPINGEGYATSDTEIEYDILPAEYPAGDALVRISKRNPDPAKPPIHLRYLTAERQGCGFVTLARGFEFDSDAEYFATVILNNGSNATKIMSREISLKPIALDLDADLNKDSLFTEDDPMENAGIGLAVRVNLDDDDGDGIIDNLDGYNGDGISGNEDDLIADINDETINFFDDDLVMVKLTSLPTTITNGTVVLEIIQGQERIRVWTDIDKGQSSVLIHPRDWFPSPDAPNPKKEWMLGQDIANISELPKILYIEGLKEADTAGDTTILVSKYLSPLGDEVEIDRLSITLFSMDVVPDYNRDGVIDSLDRNKVSQHEPWRFWINDDNDAGADDSGIGGSSNDLPGQNKDQESTKVSNIRDLVDFFPLYLDINSVLSRWPSGNGYKYKLVGGDGALSIFFPHESGTYLSINRVNDYLENIPFAQSLVGLTLRPLSEKGIELDNSFLSAINLHPDYAVVMVNALQEGNTWIALQVINESGKIEHELMFPIEILPVEQMFGHNNLRWVAGAPDGDPDRFVEIDPQTQKLMVGDNYETGKQPYCMQGVDKSLVWMHGYAVDSKAARGTYAEVFKRFFHAGLTGRFYGITWFGDPPDGSLAPKPHYHQATVNAFATAGTYKDFVSSIPGATSIAAHSLGNLVAGSAVQDHGLFNFANYFAIDAAVALEAYGQVSDVSTLVNPDGRFPADPNSDMVRVGDWPDYIAAGQERLLASEWYKLFENADPPDNRSQLTWRNRLSKVVSGRMYNFHSSTEEVLRRYPGDNIFFDGNGLLADLAISSWVKQEKFKGRRSILNPGDDVVGASSNYCGWSFNGHYWKLELLSVDHRRLYTPQEARDEIDEDELKAEPFFAFDNRHFFPNPLSLDNPSLDELASPTGSDFVERLISETNLKSYYTSNQAAQGKVKVKDWLLAEAFPATTLPMGANKNIVFQNIEKQNIDMSLEKGAGGCKTSEDLWPRKEEGVKVWFHSDYKDIPYQHVYEFYKKITR